MSPKAGSVREPAAAARRGRPRGRPSVADVAAIDRAVVAAARVQFLEAGYEAATMDAIAAAAGVSKGTLYARYAAKEALFRSVVEQQFKMIDERAGEGNDRLPTDFEQRLRWHAAMMVNATLWPEYKMLLSLLSSAVTSFPDMARLQYEIGPEATVNFMARDMQASFPGPDADRIDWRAYASLFAHSIWGWYNAESSVRDVSLDEATAFCAKIIRVLLASLRHDPLDEDPQEHGAELA